MWICQPLTSHSRINSKPSSSSDVSLHCPWVGRRQVSTSRTAVITRIPDKGNPAILPSNCTLSYLVLLRLCRDLKYFLQNLHPLRKPSYNPGLLPLPPECVYTSVYTTTPGYIPPHHLRATGHRTLALCRLGKRSTS